LPKSVFENQTAETEFWFLNYEVISVPFLEKLISDIFIGFRTPLMLFVEDGENGVYSAEF